MQPNYVLQPSYQSMALLIEGLHAGKLLLELVGNSQEFMQVSASHRAAKMKRVWVSKGIWLSKRGLWN